MSDPITFDTSHCAGGAYNHCSSKIIVHDSYVETFTRQGYFTFQFKDFDNVLLFPACFSNAYTYIIFVDNINKNNPKTNDNYFSPETLDHKHKIWLCCGAFGYKKAAKAGQQVYSEIKKRFDSYKEHGSQLSFNKNESSFYKKFFEKYGIDFDNFREKLTFLESRDKGVSNLLYQDSVTHTIRTVYSIAYSDDFLVAISEGMIDGVIPLYTGFSKQDFGVVLTKKEADEEFVNCLKVCDENFDKITQMIIPMEKVQYIEAYQNVSTLKKYANSPSTVNMMVTEAMFGTAAAINKSNRANETMSFDWSGYKVIFDPSITLDLYFDGDIVKNSTDLQQLIRIKSKDAFERKELAKIINLQGNHNNQISAADEIRKFKQLADDGIITQEEFEAKKKELLGL